MPFIIFLLTHHNNSANCMPDSCVL